MSRAALILRSASNRATRRIAIRWGEQLDMYPVVGFPKSGGTWLCRMLADALRLPFAQVPLLPVAMPSVLHGHWRYHPRLRNVTCTVRDGRDTMVSFYFYCKLHYEHGPPPRIRRMFEHLYGSRADLNDARANLPGFIEAIFKNPIGTRLTWPQYCREWHDRPGVSIVRYEQLLSDTEAQLARVTASLGRETDAWRLAWAAEGNSMRRTTGRRHGQEDRGSVVRKGIAGDWRAHFSDESCALFADLAGDTLVELGYEQSRDWRNWAVYPMDPHAARADETNSDLPSFGMSASGGPD